MVQLLISETWCVCIHCASMSNVIGVITVTPSRSYRKRQPTNAVWLFMWFIMWLMDMNPSSHIRPCESYCAQLKWDKWKSTFHSQGRHADCCPCTASTVNPSCHVKCSRCDQSYSRNNLVNHVEIKHHEAKSMCNFCNQSLIKPHTLQSHIQTAHEINWSRLRSAPSQNTHEPHPASSPKRHGAHPAQWQNRQLKFTKKCENCKLPTIYRPNFSKHIAYTHLHIVYNHISE